MSGVQWFLFYRGTLALNDDSRRYQRTKHQAARAMGAKITYGWRDHNNFGGTTDVTGARPVLCGYVYKL